MSLRIQNVLLVVSLLGAEVAHAQVPTASLPPDDDEPAPAPRSATTQANAGVPNSGAAAAGSSLPIESAGAPSAHSVPSPATSEGPAIANPGALPGRASPSPTTNAEPAQASPRTSMPATQAQVSASDRLGHAKLSLTLPEPGSKAYVFPRSNDPDAFPAESALLQCTNQCQLELPLGSYSIRVETTEGVRSYGELELDKSRWLAVAPANQVARDFGVVAGTVGAVTTVLGVALLAEVICRSCSDTARNWGGAASLSLGLPMTALGWSLYFVHRDAKLVERDLTPPLPAETKGPNARRTFDGYVAGAIVAF